MGRWVAVRLPAEVELALLEGHETGGRKETRPRHRIFGEKFMKKAKHQSRLSIHT
jgi:hypothetical protein